VSILQQQAKRAHIAQELINTLCDFWAGLARKIFGKQRIFYYSPIFDLKQGLEEAASLHRQYQTELQTLLLRAVNSS
jgi:hypothetical protein